MTFCTLFEPFYLKYQVTDAHQLEILERYNTHIQQQSEAPDQPPGWACEVETSFEYKDNPPNNVSTHPVVDDLNVNEIFQHYIFDSLNQLNFPVSPYTISTWYNAYGKNHYQEPHNHLTSQLSGVYFLSFDRDIHGSFHFVNPMQDLIRLAYGKACGPENPRSFFREEEEPVVTSGTLIIFPSFMQHRVVRPTPEDRPKMEQFTDENYPKRVTISFNIDLYDWYSHAPSLRNNITNP